MLRSSEMFVEHIQSSTPQNALQHVLVCLDGLRRACAWNFTS